MAQDCDGTQGERDYCGRFAPSPTGALHFGSLVAAVGSWLDARAHRGRWLVRIEDLDTPRSVPGAADEILRALEGFGLDWDGEIVWQSRRVAAYRDAFERLRERGRVFGCRCTRKEIADSALAADGTHRYPGTCREGLPVGALPRAFRLRVDPGEICFDDRLQGRVCQDVASEVGDFVLLRADGIFAYQLAVVVDDAWQGITEVVRGADLLDSTARQIMLQRMLGYRTPAYLHLPVALNADGEKLSKQTRARPIESRDAGRTLAAALGFLGIPVPAEAAGEHPRALLELALPIWSASRLVHARSIRAPAGMG